MLTEISTVCCRSTHIKTNKMPQPASYISTLYFSSLHHHRSCNRTWVCVAYFLAAKPWNQSGKFPLLRMSGACVSVNHLSTSSFRPPPDVSMWRSTPGLCSIFTPGAGRAVLEHHVYSLLGWCLTLKRKMKCLIWLFPFDISLVWIVVLLPVTLLPLITLPVSFYYLCSWSYIEL